MQEAKISLEHRVYCTQCRCDFWLPRGPQIECDSGHQLANNFPYDSYWNYCCGCDAFYPSNGLEGKEAESNCLLCERSLNRRFFCNSCNVITVEAVDGESRRRPVEFSEDGCPFPSCPGCLLAASPSNLLIHECYSLFVTILTERQVCPFCKDPITTPARVNQQPEVLVNAVITVKKKTNFAFFESIAQRNTSKWRSYLPSSKKGWLEFIGIVSFILTAIGLIVALVPEAQQAVSWPIKKAFKAPLIVSEIECPAHFVLAGERLRLTARAKVTSENPKFHWTTTAGSLITQKDHNGQSEIELDTGGVSAFSVPREVVIRLTVDDAYGETVQRHERITVIPRRLANNPPVLKIPPRCYCTIQEVVAGESVSLYAAAYDENEGDVLNYEWQSSSPSAQLIPISSAAGSSVILNTSGVNPKAAPVPVKIYLTVKDGNGGEVMDDITINVLPSELAGNRTDSTKNETLQNHAPKLEAFMADKTTIDAGETVRLWAYVTDADGDTPIYYDWRASAGDIQDKNETAILTTTGINTSEVIIFLTVGDNRGGRTSQKLFVKVRNTPASAPSPSPSPVQAKANE